MPKLLKFTHPSDFVNEITFLIEEKILDSYERNGLVRLALSGGNTPLPIYQSLANSQVIPWERVEFYLADERYVPIENKDSNQKMISEAFGGVMSFLYGFEAWNTALSIQESSTKYNQILESLSDETDFLFDLTILGMGADGHTASLFPNDSQTLSNLDDLSTYSLNTSGTPKERLTLTYPAILNSEDIFLLLGTADKIKTLEKALDSESTYLDYPIRKILDEHKNTTVFVLSDEKPISTDE
jgi:6-phosphogluconolactonase